MSLKTPHDAPSTVHAMSNEPHRVKDYYDDFAGHLLRDYIRGNARLTAQHDFCRDALSPRTGSVLIMGCGSGESSYYIAQKLAPKADIWAVDISPENIRMAQALFPHPRITYRVMDITQTSPGQQFDAVLLPDVYEHIPRAQRNILHQALHRLLNPRGQVLITIPSQSHQENLMAAGKGLQVVDEVVSLQDLQVLADDIQGHLSYYNIVNVFRSGDYVHAVVAAGPEAEYRLCDTDRTALRRANRPRRGPRYRVARLRRRWRRWRNTRHVRKALGAPAVASAVKKLDSTQPPSAETS